MSFCYLILCFVFFRAMLRLFILILVENKKKDPGMTASPLWVSEELEYWDSSIRFVHIAATYSELIAVSTLGQLHQWRWADSHPYQRNDVSLYVTEILDLCKCKQ